MRPAQNKNVASVIIIFLLLAGLITGCLQQKGSGSKNSTKIVQVATETNPVDWYEAIRWQSNQSIKEMLEQGTDPDQLFFNGEAALHLAVEQGNFKLAELLLAYGADVNIQERKEGFTPLMYAAIKDDRKMMVFLAAHGADPTLGDADGFSTYHYLSARGNNAAIQLLAANGPIPEELTTNDGLTVADVASLAKKTVRISVASAAN